MKNLTLFGKVNFGLGIIFFILGVLLFVQNFNEIFVFKDQYLSISLVCLGIALFFASYLQQKIRNKHS